MSFGERLRRELEEREMSVKRFQETLHDKGIKGSSHSSVWGWLKGDKEPPLEFVRAAAQLLEVRERWLEVGGDEPRTEREAKIIEATSEPDENRFHKAWRALRAVTGRYIPYRHRPLSPVEQEALQDLLIRLLDAGQDKEFEDYDEEQMADALEGLTWLLWLPLMVLGSPRYTDGQDATPPPDPDGRYFMAMYQALSLAMPAAGEGYEGHTATTVRALRHLQESINERSSHIGWVTRGPDRRASSEEADQS